MKCKINENRYECYKNYHNSDELRKSMNELARVTFGGLTFEPWYEQGFWSENCIPYALFDQGTCVANIFAYIFDVVIAGRKRRYIQLGTVMTHSDYRKQGLSRFLMEKVIEDWADRCDMIYLYANDKVLDFYPKFGFKAEKEYQYNKYAAKKNGRVQKLNIDNAEDRTILMQKIGLPNPFAEIQMQNCVEIIMFHCIMFQRDHLYYLPEYDAVVVSEAVGDHVICYDIFCSKDDNFDEILSVISCENGGMVYLGFTPGKEYGCKADLLREEDTTLFVLMGGDSIFENSKRMLPVLCHT